MFDKQWFEKYKKVTLVLLNLPLAGLVFRRSALSAAVTVNADANGSPADGDKILIRYKDNATPRAITHNAQYASLIGTMITTTTASKWSYELFEWNATDSKYYCLASGTQA